MSESSGSRIFYFDQLRALAIILVIIIHCVTIAKPFIVNAWLVHHLTGFSLKYYTILPELE